MNVAGYVLAGGKSSRMGRDKALLEIDGVTLAEQTAALVRSAAGNATLIGDPEKYARLGVPVIPDRRPGNGPLAGMEAALLDSSSEWNLIVACDMGSMQEGFLQTLCRLALRLSAEADCIVPCSPEQCSQPLSAVYRRRCVATFSAALDAGNRKVTEAVSMLKVRYWRAPDAVVFQNINTPEEWNRYVNGRTQ